LQSAGTLSKMPAIINRTLAETAMPRVLAISSQVVRGHIGLSAVVPALQAFGNEVWPMPTVLLSNHPGHERFAATRIAPGDLRAMLDALDDSGWLGEIDAVLTGYLPTREHVAFAAEVVARVSSRRDQPVIYLCDPVLGDDPKGLYVAPEAAASIRDLLLPRAHILTPNRFELAWLSGMPVAGPEDAVVAARRLRDGSNISHLLATSVPADGARLFNVLLRDEGVQPLAFSVEQAPIAPHGTGDLLSGLVLGRCLGGERPYDAIARALAGVAQAIADSVGRDELDLGLIGEWHPRHDRVSVVWL